MEMQRRTRSSIKITRVSFSFQPVNNIKPNLLVIALLVRRGASLPGRDEIAWEHVPRLGVQLLLKMIERSSWE
jgi:hypothetical protein